MSEHKQKQGYTNWRIIEHGEEDAVKFGLHHVQYDSDGHPIFATPPLMMGSEQELLATLDSLAKAFTMPSLLESEIKLPGLGAKLDA